jgi:hypothetical protein
LSPAVSPSGKKVAVASFRAEGWKGEIEDLQTYIFLMNVERPPLERKRLIKNGGWPAWASDNVLFFHRKVGETWGVFRFTISSGETVRVTPAEYDAVTPAAVGIRPQIDSHQTRRTHTNTKFIAKGTYRALSFFCLFLNSCGYK